MQNTILHWLTQKKYTGNISPGNGGTGGSQEKQPRGQLEPPLALFRWQQDSAKPPAAHWNHWDHCYGISPTCCSVCGSGHQVTAFIQSPAANGDVSSTTLRVQAAKGWWHWRACRKLSANWCTALTNTRCVHLESLQSSVLTKIVWCTEYCVAQWETSAWQNLLKFPECSCIRTKRSLRVFGGLRTLVKAETPSYPRISTQSLKLWSTLDKVYFWPAGWKLGAEWCRLQLWDWLWGCWNRVGWAQLFPLSFVFGRVASMGVACQQPVLPALGMEKYISSPKLMKALYLPCRAASAGDMGRAVHAPLSPIPYSHPSSRS